MALTDAYMVAAGRIPDLFAKIRDGQAPDQFTIQLLKDWGSPRQMTERSYQS